MSKCACSSPDGQRCIDLRYGHARYDDLDHDEEADDLDPCVCACHLDYDELSEAEEAMDWETAQAADA